MIYKNLMVPSLSKHTSLVNFHEDSITSFYAKLLTNKQINKQTPVNIPSFEEAKKRMASGNTACVFCSAHDSGFAVCYVAAPRHSFVPIPTRPRKKKYSVHHCWYRCLMNIWFMFNEPIVPAYRRWCIIMPPPPIPGH